MIKTILIFMVLTISVGTSYSQNLLKSLYDLDSFPEEMKNSKSFIEEVSSDILIYNYIFGGSENFQFDLKSTNGLEIELPMLNGFSLNFLDKTTKAPLLDYTFHVGYNFKYRNYFDEFDINESTFSLSSIFDLATKYYDLDDYDLAHKTLSIYKPELDYNTKRLQFFETLAEAFEIEDTLDFNTIENDEENEDLLSTEVEELMLDIILDEIESETIAPQIFDSFILDKTNDVTTKANMAQLFNNKTIINEIETEVLQPKITIDLYKGAYFNIPAQYLTINSTETEAFPITSIEIKIDYKTQQLYIHFLSKTIETITLNKTFFKGENDEVQTKKLSLVLSETDTKFQVYKFNPYQRSTGEPLEINLNN
ncbi:hypothetical protein [Winogradskyella vidalii]|uniref:hypothetical protein n=1 Tax=Winogradskyella vidalii TaxID=2615024 RepID=UPI0015C9F8F6|nr:hypothetical protein [Winogradskyella vidalii]